MEHGEVHHILHLVPFVSSTSPLAVDHIVRLFISQVIQMWNALTSLNYSRKHGATSKNCTLSLSIRDWDTVTWKQVGHPLVGTLITSASSDSHSRLRWPSDRQDIAIFQHSALWSSDVTIHIDGKHVLSGGQDKMISDRAVPKDVLPERLASTARFRY
jgi:hypothetical protein